MKKSFILCVAILSTVLILLTSCGVDGSGTPQDTTTASETTPVPNDTTTPDHETTSSDTPSTPSDAVTQYQGKISSPDNTDLSGIKIDVYEVISAKIGVDPDPRNIKYTTYDPSRDFSFLEDKYVYLFSVYTDINGGFSFDLPCSSGAIRFDSDTFPKQHGIRCAENSRNDFNAKNSVVFYADNVDTLSVEFVLERAESAYLTFVKEHDSFGFSPVLVNGVGEILYADAEITNGRFDDGFIDAMISGAEINYTATIVYDDLSQTVTYPVSWEHLYYWEWRVGYLYYNNYITKEQYDNIFATTEPSKILPVM
ncbi:MAG: hypothetical protein IJY27_00300 [Clostridia bacterium]|nr:hypothetical protein [Clostridia bacterium]